MHTAEGYPAFSGHITINNLASDQMGLVLITGDTLSVYRGSNSTPDASYYIGDFNGWAVATTDEAGSYALPVSFIEGSNPMSYLAVKDPHITGFDGDTIARDDEDVNTESTWRAPFFTTVEGYWTGVAAVCPRGGGWNVTYTCDAYEGNTSNTWEYADERPYESGAIAMPMSIFVLTDVMEEMGEINGYLENRCPYSGVVGFVFIGNGNGGGAGAPQPATPPKVDIDIEGWEADADEGYEDRPGGFVVRNFDDNHAPRMAVVIKKASGPGVDDNTTLTFTNKSAKVDLYDAATGGNKLTFDAKGQKTIRNGDIPANGQTYYVQGKNASAKRRDVVLGLDVGTGHDEVRITVLWVEITARCNPGDPAHVPPILPDEVSPQNENAARAVIVALFFKELGVWKKGLDRYGMGIELKGTVQPSDFIGTIVLQRDCASRYFKDKNNGSTFWQKRDFSDPIPPGNDIAGGAAYRDDDPQSDNSHGEIYDWDAPGIAFWAHLSGYNANRVNWLLKRSSWFWMS